MPFAQKQTLDMESLFTEDINIILGTTDRMKEISERPIIRVAGGSRDAAAD
jgi:hypothetical protein